VSEPDNPSAMVISGDQKLSLGLLAGFLAVAGIACGAILVSLRRLLTLNAVVYVNRGQRTAFVLRLRDLVIQDPFRLTNIFRLADSPPGAVESSSPLNYFRRST